MATYYVDKTNGSDSNAGTSESTAWATVGHAVSYASLAAGDTIWIAPGTYFETLTFATDGSSGSPINWRGDPDCTRNWGSGVEPGPVKISGANSSTLVPASTGTLITLTGVEYNTFYDLVLDGIDASSSSNRIIYGDYGSEQHFVRCCIMGGYYCCEAVKIDNCVIIGGYYSANLCIGSRDGYVKNSLIVSLYIGSYNSDLDQSIIIAPSAAAKENGSMKNCLVLGATYGINYPASGYTDANNVFMGCQYMANHAYADMANSIGISYLDAGSITDDWSSSVIIYNSGTNVSTPPDDGHIFTLPPPAKMIKYISQAFKFVEYNDYDIGDDTNATSETTDIEGRARSFRPADETADQKGQGPWALTDYSLKYDSTDGNKIRIEKKGEEILYIPLKADTAISISVDVDSGNLSATPVYPEIELEPEVSGLFTAVTDTATSTSDTLTVSLSTTTAPDYDCMARLILKAKDTNTNAYAEFHSIEVS